MTLILLLAISENGERYNKTHLLVGRSASPIGLASKTDLFQHIPKCRNKNFFHEA